MRTIVSERNFSNCRSTVGFVIFQAIFVDNCVVLLLWLCESEVEDVLHLRTNKEVTTPRLLYWCLLVEIMFVVCFFRHRNLWV